jgi:hypothetical protein
MDDREILEFVGFSCLMAIGLLILIGKIIIYPFELIFRRDK